MKKTQNKTITVKTNEENPEPLELIAKSIIEISEAVEKINSGPLKRNTVVLLIQDITKLPQRDINKVLDAAVLLKTHFLKEARKKD